VSAAADRLSPQDVAFLYLESAVTVMHVGTVAIFAAEDGFDYDALCDLVAARTTLEPRWRQRIREVPGHLANPVWVDDEDFDLGYHVRRSALPRPGTDDQLRELVGRVQSRRLDRDRPLWELYLVEGLEEVAGVGKRFALIAKTHHALARAGSALDILSLLLVDAPAAAGAGEQDWTPQPEPSALDLVLGAVTDNLRRPTQVLDTARAEVADVKAAAGRLLGAAGGVLGALGRTLRPAAPSPLNVRIGEQRRYGMTAHRLDDYRRVHDAHDATVNDVVLATVAGALRTWLLTRGESVTPATTLRALVPVGAGVPGGAGRSMDRLTALAVDLPIGEQSPVVRLHRVAYATKAHRESGESVAADAIASLSGFAPPRIHAAAARFGARATRRLFNVVVTNVPGPQQPLYAGTARMLECYPVVPLAQDQALTIGLTSYDGGMFYGLNVDRDAMPDVDVLAQCIDESLAELVETVR
jgi:WS/DGAT/MGAT family acyltransferase